MPPFRVATASQCDLGACKDSPVPETLPSRFLCGSERPEAASHGGPASRRHMGSPRAGARKNRLVTSLGDWELLPSAPFLPSCHSCHTLVHRPWACPGQVLGRDERDSHCSGGAQPVPRGGSKELPRGGAAGGGPEGGRGLSSWREREDGWCLWAEGRIHSCLCVPGIGPPSIPEGKVSVASGLPRGLEGSLSLHWPGDPAFQPEGFLQNRSGIMQFHNFPGLQTRKWRLSRGSPPGLQGP